ncbi:MAG TPA: hypothetical protein VFV51_08370 [Vicinamibacterales bacterium]|nr:hypothetical protein [Vicinamibacterales bacterium]
MAALTDARDRRCEPRRSAGSARCKPDAVLRPGQPVLLINISSRAALVESDARLRPGRITELQLALGAGRASIRGRLDRCHVAALEPLRYRGVLVFEDRLELADE